MQESAYDYTRRAFHGAPKNPGPCGIVRKDHRPIRLLNPTHILADQGWEALFIADTGAHTILIADIETGEILLKAGNGIRGLEDGPYESASFDTPMGLAAEGDFLYVADTGNNAIRRVNLVKRTVSTVLSADTAAIPGFWLPAGIAAADGFLYAASAGSGIIWQIHPYLCLLRPVARAPFTGFHAMGLVQIRRRMYVSDCTRGQIFSFRVPAGTAVPDTRMKILPGPTRSVSWKPLGMAGAGDRLLLCTRGRVDELDPESGTTVREYSRFPVADPGAGAFHQSGLFGVSATENSIYLSDSRTGEILRGNRTTGEFAPFPLNGPQSS